MRDVRVHVQARLINEMEKIQYVAHLHGVQIVGRIPTYMRQVTLKKAEASKLKIGSKSEKISRYVGSLRSRSNIYKKGSPKLL